MDSVADETEIKFPGKEKKRKNQKNTLLEKEGHSYVGLHAWDFLHGWVVFGDDHVNVGWSLIWLLLLLN